jgi:hypothetical protein
VQNKTRLPHRIVFLVSVSAGYKHREIAIGAKKNKQTTKKAKEKK